MLHQHIHAWEMSPTPEKALPTGKLLRDGLIPDSGHLLHMPRYVANVLLVWILLRDLSQCSHIDMWIGDYQEAILSNEKAVEADNRYLAARGPANFYTIYRLHDNHLGMAAAMYAGAYSKALKAADEILSLPTGVVAHFPDWLEAMMDNRYHVLMRFGKWDEILETPEPEDKELFCSVIATRLCARAVALASLGRADEAEAERIKFEEALKRIPDTRMLFNNSVANVMAVASKFALGEVRYRQGRYDEAFGALREAVRLSEELIYQGEFEEVNDRSLESYNERILSPHLEPEAWILPSRHALGALLMEQGHRAEAEQVLRGDLEKHPHNIWSLRGLVNCVEADGRGGSDEAKAWKEELKKLEKIADTEIETPCFCSSMKGAKVHDEAPKAMPAIIQVA
jgi:tetratricopeptide (TPR) repeat protein